MAWMDEGRKLFSKIKKGDRVRILEIRGCMGTIRHNPREGVVTRIERGSLFPLKSKVRFAVIRLDTGETIKKCTDIHLWWFRYGMPEYGE